MNFNFIQLLNEDEDTDAQRTKQPSSDATVGKATASHVGTAIHRPRSNKKITLKRKQSRRRRQTTRKRVNTTTYSPQSRLLGALVATMLLVTPQGCEPGCVVASSIYQCLPFGCLGTVGCCLAADLRREHVRHRSIGAPFEQRILDTNAEASTTAFDELIAKKLMEHKNNVVAAREDINAIMYSRPAKRELFPGFMVPSTVLAQDIVCARLTNNVQFEETLRANLTKETGSLPACSGRR